MRTPDSIAKLQHAARSGSFATYRDYAALINDQSRRMLTLRGLFEFRFAATPIPLDEVEAAAAIVKRFATGAMSLGSISPEAHTTLAVAMNRIGGKSNTGEGGEDFHRYALIKAGETLRSRIESAVVDIPLKEGDSLRSKIKQVASAASSDGRVPSSADQIQIRWRRVPNRVRGQLPGTRSRIHATLRFSVPGVGLISPPPHRDIYSIEDLAQLIHDLKNANPRVDFSQARLRGGRRNGRRRRREGKADHVTIAGHDAARAHPRVLDQARGDALGARLAETQQTLVLNRLRGRIAVQVDGQIKTGRDVVIGAMLGADEFGFSTAPLVTAGCVMMRKCHLNTCPVGVATQDRATQKFMGKPEHVVNYFFFVAEEARADGEARDPEVRSAERTLGPARNAPRHRALEGQRSRLFARVLPAADAARGRALPLRRAGSQAGSGTRSRADRRGDAGARPQGAGAPHLQEP
jgi:glutamate synthase domain-containing protein 2